MFHVKHIDDKYNKILYKLAYKSFKNKEIPVGAIIIYNNKIIGKGYNNRQCTNDVCGHAEIMAIKKAEKSIGDWRLNDCILISTLKPCKMCTEIIRESRIKYVYYYVDQNDSNNEKKFKKINDCEEFVNKYMKIFNNFFKSLR